MRSQPAADDFPALAGPFAIQDLFLYLIETVYMARWQWTKP